MCKRVCSTSQKILKRSLVVTWPKVGAHCTNRQLQFIFNFLMICTITILYNEIIIIIVHIYVRNYNIVIYTVNDEIF